jgi:UDP-N-acetylmuramate--alanine ligase
MADVTHLIGIGGVGMSALAQALLDKGCAVSGADRQIVASDAPPPTPVLRALAAQGVALFPDDGSGVGPQTACIIVSTAIEDTNPGLRKAQAAGIPVVHRAAALAEVLSSRKLVAVAGTCGKSTVTAILGHVLTACGFDPVVVNGAQIAGWDENGARVGSVRKGAGAYAVAEVDESDKSLTAFRPYAAIITNASADHYSKEEMDAVFDAFIRDVPGPVVDGRDSSGKRHSCRFSPEVEEAIGMFPMPGAHNRANARLALAMACALGADPAQAAVALASFPGVERRLQRVGLITCGGHEVAVYDDYAHNPEKLHAMWTTLAEAFPRGVAVVWRPHGYGPLRKMLEPLAAAFRDVMRPQDALVLLPVYDAGGTADRSVNSDALAACLADASGTVALVQDLEGAEAYLRARADAFGAIVTAGARDPGLPVLARRLAEKEK